MKLNLSGLFDQSASTFQTSRTISGKQYMELTLPHPYNTQTQISVKNYVSEIDYICKRKNVPRELQEFIVKNFEKNLPKVEMQEVSVFVAGEEDLYTTVKEAGRIKTEGAEAELPGVGVATRAKQRDLKEKITLSSAVFKKTTKDFQSTKIDTYAPKPLKPKHPKPSRNVYQKLYKQKPCSRPSCKVHSTLQRHELKQFLEVRSKPQIDPTSNYIQSFNHQRKGEPVYTRLYRLRLTKEFKMNMARAENRRRVNDGMVGPKMSEGSREMVKDSRAFLERVRDEIQHRKEREEFVAMKMINFSENKQMFKPSINASYAKPRVYDFMNRSAQFSYEPSSLQRSKTQTVDVLNRSAEIVRNKQVKYFQSLTQRLFVGGKLVLDADTISQLTDQEFPVIYPFLTRIEADRNMSESHFEEAFQKYYETLTVMEKHVLKGVNERGRKEKSDRSSFPFKPKLNNQSMAIAAKTDYERVLSFV